MSPKRKTNEGKQISIKFSPCPFPNEGWKEVFNKNRKKTVTEKQKYYNPYIISSKIVQH